MSAFR